MTPGRIYTLAWGFYLAMAVAGVLWMGARQGRVGLDLFVDPGGWWIDVAAGLAAGGLLLAVWQVARGRVRGARGLEGRIADLLGPIEPSEAVALAILSGFSEELFFRGAMQGAWGWLPATVVFAVLHTGPGPDYRIWTLFALVAGLLFAALMAWRGNLCAPVLAHVLVNAVNLRRIGRRGREAPAPPDG